MNKFVFISRKDGAVCVLCCQTVIRQTSSVRRPFETRHKKNLEDETDGVHSIKTAAQCEEQSSVFTTICAAKNHATEDAQCIAKQGKPFSDGDI